MNEFMFVYTCKYRSIKIIRSVLKKLDFNQCNVRLQLLQCTLANQPPQHKNRSLSLILQYALDTIGFKLVINLDEQWQRP